MALTTTPELLRELATLYQRIAELERAGGLRPGEGAPPELKRDVPEMADGLHAAVAAFADDIVGILTPAGDILAINDAVTRLVGYPPAEVIGKNAWSFVNPEDLAPLASARSAPLDDAIPIEVRVRRADGGERWLEFSARPWPREAPRYIVARWRDAEPRRDAARRTPDELRLAAELRRAAALARISQLALGLPEVQDLLDAAVALVPAALDLPVGAFVEPAGAALRVRAATGVPDAARAARLPALMTLAGRVRAGGVPEQSSDVARDGRLADPLLAAAGAAAALAVPVRGKERVHGVLLVAGRLPRHHVPEEIHFVETVANVVATAIDARAAEEALRGRERLARAVFDRARDGLAIVDDEGRCVDVNPATERILGATFEALRGRRPAEVVQTDVTFTQPAGEARQVMLGAVHGPGGPREVEWELVPGILPGLGLAVLRDVTERRAVQAREVLTDRLISVGSIAAGVADELDSPLAQVTARLEYLAAALPAALPPPAGASLAEAVGESRRGLEQLRVTLDDLRTFARTGCEEAGPADLDAVIRSCVAMTSSELRGRARLERDLPPLPPVAVDPARLAQVVVNLLRNAVQAIGDGDPETNLIRIAGRAVPDGQVTLEISDTGGGIAPSVLPRLFEPFFTTSPGKGAGLGLPICRTIVEGAGGRIDVQSQPGAGSVFRVVLPRARSGARPGGPPR